MNPNFLMVESRSDVFSFSVKPLIGGKKQDEFAHCDVASCDPNEKSGECQFNRDQTLQSSKWMGVSDEHYTQHLEARL